jgi:hypothetical protein
MKNVKNSPVNIVFSISHVNRFVILFHLLSADGFSFSSLISEEMGGSQIYLINN